MYEKEIEEIDNELNQFEKDKKLEKRWYIGILICFLIIVSYLVGVRVYADNAGYLEVKEYTPTLNLEYNLNNCPYENYEKIRADLNKLFGTSFYIYQETNIGWASATTNLHFRIIQVDMNFMNKTVYTYVLAHELQHLTTYIGNEANTEFGCIKCLYESGNPYFIEVAKWATMKNIYNYGNNGVYECGYYLQEYFNEII